MKKLYVTPSLKVVNLNMQVLLCGSMEDNGSSSFEGMDDLPSGPGASSMNSSSNIWVSNTSSIWD